MPRHAFRSLLFAAMATLPARATPIDDFKLTGEGHTITYSLPATSSFPDFSLFNSFQETAVTTVDGVAAPETGQYYIIGFPNLSLVLSVPHTAYPNAVALYLKGPSFVSYTTVPAVNPSPYLQDDIVATFLPGTYTLQSLTQQIFPQSPPVAYTLTITPETTTSPTPEPSTLALLATGALSVFAFAKRRDTAPIAAKRQKN